MLFFRLTGVVLTLSAVTLLAASCGSASNNDACLSICEEQASCPGGDSLPGDDCAAGCNQLQALSEASGCDGLDVYLDCLDSVSDICEPDISGCPQTVISYAFCVSSYCDSHETDPECKGILCSTSTSGTSGDCYVARQCTGEPEYALDCMGDSCACFKDGISTGDVPYEEVFCSGDLDAELAAARTACGWQ